MQKNFIFHLETNFTDADIECFKQRRKLLQQIPSWKWHLFNKISQKKKISTTKYFEGVLFIEKIILLNVKQGETQF